MSNNECYELGIWTPNVEYLVDKSERSMYRVRRRWPRFLRAWLFRRRALFYLDVIAALELGRVLNSLTITADITR